MLTPDRWQRLKLLYESALTLNSGEQDRFLMDSCIDDEELRQTLRRMLDQTTLPGGILESPIASLVSNECANRTQTFVEGQLVHGRFEVKHLIGRGGMGEVYQAYDRELQEEVALKTVRGDSENPSSMLMRLRQEVRRSRRISHPNVCRVYDFFPSSPTNGNVAFLTMKLVEGSTLADAIRNRAPMTITEIAPIAAQMLSALSAAHEAGLIHRDFKPGNIMLVSRDAKNCHVVVTDFGLAAERAVLSGATQDGLSQRLVGTPAYMAPEQFKGRATVASDIYAFGVVLFEMITGTTPDAEAREMGNDFAGVMLSASALDRLQNTPAPWRSIVLRCLKTEPGERFRTVQEIVKALDCGPITNDADPPVSRRKYLRRLFFAGVPAAGAAALWRYIGPTAVLASVLVLPFKEMGENGESGDSALLADGLTDGVIDALRQRRRLRVIAHGSSFHYKGRAADARSINRELNVSHVLSGELAVKGNTAQLSALLVTAPQGSSVWSKVYSLSLNSIREIEAWVAHDVAMTLKVGSNDALPEVQRLSDSDLEAYKLYLKGRFQWGLRTEAGLRLAIGFFREAIGIEPANERAYCGLADAYAMLGFYGFASPNDVTPVAKAAAQRALAINGTLAEAHTSLGMIQAIYDWDWPGAVRSLSKAIDLDPNYPTAHQWYAYCLAWTAKAREAREHMMTAQVLDPLSLSILQGLGWLAFWSRDYRAAEAHLRRAIALDPKYRPVYAPLALTCAQQSRYSEALAILKEAKDLDRDPNNASEIARIYARSAQRSNALQAIAEAEHLALNPASSGVTMAMAYEALGDPDKAFRWLYAAYEERSSQLAFLKVDPRLDGLRSDTRFDDLMRKTHFVLARKDR